MDRNFRQLFLQCYGCEDRDYERTLFRKCLYRHALPLALLLYRRNPARFREDFDLVREVGHAHNREEVICELNRFYGRNVRDRSWLRRFLLLRISGKRLLKIQRKVFSFTPDATRPGGG